MTSMKRIIITFHMKHVIILTGLLLFNTQFFSRTRGLFLQEFCIILIESPVCSSLLFLNPSMSLLNSRL